MQPDDMEKAFRQKMKSHTPAWDKNKNWDAIEARLPQQRKRRPWWLFWLLSATVLAGAVIGWALARASETATAETIENQNVAKEEEVVENRSASISPQAETTETATAPTAGRNDAAPIFFEKRAIQNGAAASATESTSTEFLGKKTPTGTPGNPSANPTAGTDGNATAPISPQAENTGQDLAASDPVTRQRQTAGLEKLPTETRPLDLPQAEIDLNAAPVERTEVLKNKPRFGFEIYGGMGRPVRRFSATSPENQPWLDERQERETVLESIEAGLLVSTRFRGGWSLSTGLEFQQINERFRWQQVTTETVSVYSDSAYFYYDAVNQRHFIGDTVQATVTERRRVTNFNTHTFFNVPLLAGFEKRFPYFSLRATGGPVLQFYRGFEGVIFDENGDLLTSGEQGIYQNKMALGLQAGLDISRPVGRLGEVFIGVQFRQGLTSLTNATAGFEQRYGNLGARLGWRF